MTLDWSPLRRAVRPGLPLWWRDDDAVAPTRALDGLQDLAAELKVPLHLAVIPARAQADLAGRLDPSVRVLVHGLWHADTSASGAKKSEFQRPRPEAATETQTALGYMRAHFGRSLVPVFVPPWNRIDDGIARALGPQGYTGLSTFGPRAHQAAVGLPRLNTHIDPIDWRGTRGLADPGTLIARAAAQIDAHPEEPIGLLTHHLVHTPEVTAFTRALLCEMLEAGAVPSPIESLIP